ncbi:MAG: hypothetical protein RBS08_04195 [Bdellovibrionales bacterium]|nr:hypothetical protein [Bdellovibrionales bacterium]
MLEKFKKSMRYIERRHKKKVTGAGVALGGTVAVGGVIATGIVATPFIPLMLLVPLYGGGMAGLLGGDTSRVRQNEFSVNGFKLVGDAHDLTQIKAMQEYIDKKTAKLKHLGSLPSKLEEQLQRHIADVAPVLQRVRVYKSYAWRDEEKGEQSLFEFQRGFIDEKGADARQAVARIELVPMGLAPRKDPVRLIVEQKKDTPALPAPEVLSGEFKALADKVDGVAGRVEALEKPQEPETTARLDKPKFNGRR